MRRARRVALGAVAVLFWYFAYLALTLPDVRPLRERPPQTTAFIELRAAEARRNGQSPRRDQRWIDYTQISPSLTRAVVVAEDGRFWEHGGIDLFEIRRSIETNLARRAVARGGSTITQQLAKNLYLSPSRNPLRKMRELLITRRLEAELSKRRILEIYLNVIEWGDGIYGIEAAAQRHVGTSAAALDADQAALLAAAIINPRVLNPASPSRRLLSRQRLVRARMGRGAAPELDVPLDLEAVVELTPPDAPETRDVVSADGDESISPVGDAGHREPPSDPQPTIPGPQPPVPD